MKTITEIRDAIVACLGDMQPRNGYTYSISADKIYARFSQEIANQAEDSSYPKCFVVCDSGQLSSLTSGYNENTIAFNVIIQNKRITETGPALELTERFIDNLALLIQRNSTLRGTVQDAQLTEFYTDAGVSDPESVGVCQIVVKRFTSTT